MDIQQIEKRTDGSYEVLKDGLPFHVTREETTDVWEHVISLIAAGAPVKVQQQPEPLSMGPAIPQSVSIRQAKLALLNTGYYMQVEEIIESMEGVEGIAARIEWNAPNVQRDSTFLKQMALMLGLSEERLDELFILAATYE